MPRHTAKGFESKPSISPGGFATREDIQREHKELRSFMLTGIGIIAAVMSLILGVFYFAITFSINAKFEARDYAAAIAAKATDQKIDAINHRIDGIDHRIDGIDQRLDRMESKIDKIGDRLDRLIDRKSL
ncbi:MAG: hypothetical protein QM537_05360 [Candidatus Symbiobacter sp.]|nr:hypothetical protein [Candidatus Symbiobacter sp.]